MFAIPFGKGRISMTKGRNLGAWSCLLYRLKHVFIVILESHTRDTPSDLNKIASKNVDYQVQEDCIRRKRLVGESRAFLVHEGHKDTIHVIVNIQEIWRFKY